MIMAPKVQGMLEEVCINCQLAAMHHRAGMALCPMALSQLTVSQETLVFHGTSESST